MTTRHELLPTWYEHAHGRVQKGLPDPAELRKLLAAQGVNARGWRLYLDYGDVLFEALGQPWIDPEWPFPNGIHAAAFLCLLQSCGMDVLPPRILLCSLANWQIPGGSLALVPPLFFRAAWKACIAADYDDELCVTEFVLNTVTPLARWFFASGLHQSADTNLLKAGWPSLERRFREAVQPKPAPVPPPSTETWPVPLRSVEYDGLRFIALASAAELSVEGAAMRHCIGSYDDLCRSTSLRAFSVRHKKSGERLATLTVRFDGLVSRWQLDQIKGLQNAEPEPRVVQACAGLLFSMDEATRDDVAFQRFLQQLAVPARRPAAVYDDFECDIPF